MRSLVGLVLFLCVGAAPADITPKGPAEAIALSEANGDHGAKGRYEMIVASTGHSQFWTYVNSAADYQQPDNLAFAFKPSIALAMKARYGMPVEDYLKGKRVVVDGVVMRRVMAHAVNGRPHDFARVAHTVDVESISQIVAVENAS